MLPSKPATACKLSPGFEQEAQAMGYAPFIHLSPLEYLTILEIHGQWAFRDILSRLKDPANIYRPWAVRFLGAAAMLPREELAAAADLYALVTSSQGYQMRAHHCRAYWKVFFGVYQRTQRANQQLPGFIQTICRDDHDRWSNLLKERQQLSASKSIEKVSTKRVDSVSRMKRPEPIVIYKVRGP